MFRLSIFLTVAFLVSACSSNPHEELVPFTSDGCSSFPDGTFSQKKLWLSCCVAHDKAYWMGGTFEQRKQADEELQSCVHKVGEETIARLMLAGVRVGGSPYWPTSFRWGYGWSYGRGYQALTEEERQVAEKMLAEYEEKAQQQVELLIEK